VPTKRPLSVPPREGITGKPVFLDHSNRKLLVEEFKVIVSVPASALDI
jgi:hypothetical protein